MAKVSELLVLKIENCMLKMQALQIEGATLVEAARAEAEAPKDFVYNTGGYFQPPEPTT